MNPSGLSDLAARHGGIVRARTLLAAGASRHDLRRAIAARSLCRVREGVYAVPEVSCDVMTAAQHGGELACASVLQRHGVWILGDDPRPHVWVGSHGREFAHDRCRCVTHRDAGASAFGEVGIVQALVQLCTCLGDEAFFAAFESAWRLGLIGSSERAEIRAGLRPRNRWLVDIARGDADSGLESVLRLRLIRLGIPVECQVVIATVGRVDFLLAGVLIVEADGRAGHAREHERHKDLVRDARAARLGFQTLRFDYAMILHDWPLVRSAILARLSEVERAARVTGRRISGTGVD